MRFGVGVETEEIDIRAKLSYMACNESILHIATVIQITMAYTISSVDAISVPVIIRLEASTLHSYFETTM